MFVFRYGPALSHVHIFVSGSTSKMQAELSAHKNRAVQPAQYIIDSTASDCASSKPANQFLKTLSDVAVSKSNTASIAEFTANALQSKDPFSVDSPQSDDMINVGVEWRKSVSNKEATAFREQAISNIEQIGASLRAHGQVEEWFADVDPAIQRVCKHVNGPLIETLVNKISFHDKQCVELFRKGAQLVGVLPDSGGKLCKGKATMSVEELYSTCWQRNQKTIAELREDRNAAFLIQEIEKDSEVGRMTGLLDVESQDLGKVLLAKRFSVEQIRANGSTKIRAIDDETSSGANSCTEGGDKIVCHNLDQLVTMTKALSFRAGGFKKLSMWKADISSAYRRVPIRCEDKWMAWIALIDQDKVKIAQHNVAMFGARGSVLAWDRVGEMIRTIACKVLRIPSLRWVDDYYGAEPDGTVAHAKECFARLVQALLGPDAIEQSKLESGNPLTILGVHVRICDKNITLWPTEAKIAQWTRELKRCLDSGSMSSGAASKLAGKLSWATQNCFKRFGRAMIKPFYAQQYAPTKNGKCGPALEKAIGWWLEVFENNLTQSISMKHRTNQVSMFCDASGSPPIIAAVLFSKSSVQYCVMDCPLWLAQKLEDRNDNQIMAYEMVAIIMGLETFKAECRNSVVKIWTDNIGGECALRNKSSSAEDHNMLAHLTWLKASELNAGLWIDRVPSKYNIADGPTRPDESVGASLLNAMGARKVAAKLPSELERCDKVRYL